MSRCFVLLLMVLLPLRGWAGDLMAVDTALARAGNQHAAAVMPPDCPMHAQAAASAAEVDADPDTAGGGMPGCGSCELCVPVAEVAAPRTDVAPLARHVKRPHASAAFTSVPVATQLRPPIS